MNRNKYSGDMITELTTAEINSLLRHYPKVGGMLKLNALTEDTAHLTVRATAPLVGTINAEVTLDNFQVKGSNISANYTGGLVKAFSATIKKRLPDWIELNDNRISFDLGNFLPDFILIESVIVTDNVFRLELSIP